MDHTSLAELITQTAAEISRWESALPEFTPDPSLAVPDGDARAALSLLTGRLRENYPFFHPRYAGQMLKPPHPIAIAAYATAMLINPNNHALDGGPATARMELEAVAQIARMFGYEQHLGHLTSGGTMANIEALWVARMLHPGKAIACSSAAHYTHKRMCGVLGIPFREIPVDGTGRMDIDALEDALETGEIGTVVATMGTTSLGAVDRVDTIIQLAHKFGVRVHADAAYGGFFMLNALSRTPSVDPVPFLSLKDCDSIVVDPHKHGLQPYGCGCVVFRDPSVGALYKHDSPYTYFTSKDLHLGEISLECSRAGASAAALWCTLQCLPLEPERGLGPVLAATRQAALDWQQRALESSAIVPFSTPDLDIVTYFPASRPFTASAVSDASQTVFRTLMERPADPIYLAVLTVESASIRDKYPSFECDRPTTSIIRSVLMKPEHRTFVPVLFEEIESLIATL